MGMWYHLYCFFSKEVCENPFPDNDDFEELNKIKKEYKRQRECGIYLTDEGDIFGDLPEFYEMEELQEGRYAQQIIKELQINQRYHLNELIKLFHEKWNLDIIQIMSLISENYNTDLYMEADLEFLAIIIQKMRDNGYRYVWFCKIHY